METLNITRKENYAITQLSRGKANPINAQMVNELREVFSDFSNDDTIGGIILTGTPGFFSAGLDVIELYGYNEQEIRDFLYAFGSLHVEMTRFSKPFICAITGYCPAGGTVFAITADYRVMINDPKFSLGLNEMKVNVQITKNLIVSYAFWLGDGVSNRFVLEGKLLNPEEGLKYNLLDKITDPEDVMPAAEKKMKEYLQADPDIFAYSKQQIRQKWYDAQDVEGTTDLEQALKIWWKPEIRQRMKMLIDSFSKKK
ncbi:MAG: enoyl-CoA hydratase/isomerase family protein [Bacteroidota bacterium]